MEPNRTGLREAKKQEVRRAILTAAMALFEERGYEASTMEEIAVGANVSRPTVFNYFSNKEALLPAAFSQMIGDRMDDLESGAARELHRGAIAALRSFVVGISKIYATHPETARAFFVHCVQAGRAHRDPRAGFELRDRLDHYMTGLLAEAQERQEVRLDFEPGELMRLLFVGLFASTIGPWLWGRLGDRPLAEVVARNFDFFVDGLVGPARP